MLPPAPCAQTKIGTSALVRVPGSYTAVVVSVPTATFHSTGLISCMPPDMSSRTAPSPEHMSPEHRHQRVACLAAVLLAALLLLPRPATAQQLGYKLLGSAGIDAGVQPPPGLAIVSQTLHYDASELRDRQGN